jgi:quercetin dioxygenase-like cupin family protein
MTSAGHDNRVGGSVANSPSAVVRQDWSRAATPWPFEGRAEGFDRLALLNPDVGTTHTDLGIGRLAPRGRVPPHVQSYEQAIYVLAGQVAVQIEEHAYLLRPGDFAFIPLGALHAFANHSTEEARWMDVNSPVALRRESGRRDTFFPSDAPDRTTAAAPPDLADPTLRLVGHYEGTEADHVKSAVSTPAQATSPGPKWWTCPPSSKSVSPRRKK